MTNTVTIEQDVRKTADLSAEFAKPMPGTRLVRGFSELRSIFRSPGALQGMPGSDMFGSGDAPEKMPIIFIDGEAHRERRKAIAKFFTPRTIKERYTPVIDALCDEMIADMRSSGSARVDVDGFRLAVAVAAEILGLTETRNEQLAVRLDQMLRGDGNRSGNTLMRAVARIRLALRMRKFWNLDVGPAVKARRKQPREDVISQMVADGCSKQAILIECFIYGVAGMITTRELISMSAWHMLENDGLRQSFVEGTEQDQHDILEEILRLEPIVGMLFRKVEAPDGETESLSLDVRAANIDEEVTGPNRFAIEPGRWRRMQVTSGYMSFGDGAHRCPGAQLALYEARRYLDRLMRVPGLRIVGTPSLGYHEAVRGYEVRDLVLACDRA